MERSRGEAFWLPQAEALRRFLVGEADALVAAPGVVEVRPDLRMEPDLLAGRLGAEGTVGWDRVAERWLAVEVSGAGSRIYHRDYKG